MTSPQSAPSPSPVSESFAAHLSAREPALEVLDMAGVERVLCVVAHPDDMEYGGSAAVASWTRRGIEVHYLLLTGGEAGIATVNPSDCAAMRRAEQQAACDRVGASSLEILGFPDGLLEPTIDVRRAIAAEIRRVRPQLVMSLTWELQVRWGINHADHRACGIAVLDAVRDADNPWLYPGFGGERWKAPRALFCAADSPTDLIPLDREDIDAGIDSLAAHSGYLAALPDHPSPREVVEGATRDHATQCGAAGALPVRAVRL